MEILKRIKKLLETESAVPANSIGTGAGVAVYDKLLKKRKLANPTNTLNKTVTSGPRELPWNNVSNTFKNGNRITLQNPLHNLQKNDPSDTLVKRLQKSGRKSKAIKIQ